MKKKLLTLFLAICMICTLVPFGAFAASSMEQVSIDVTYNQSAARRMLKKINEFRADDNSWYYAKNNVSKIYKDLEPLAYDYTLEKIAMQRAAEIVINMDHTRPNGKSYKTLIGSNYTAYAENLDCGHDDYNEAFKAWKQDDGNTYAKQEKRRNMLSDSFNAVGIACVNYNGYYYWVQIFGKTETVDETATESNDAATTVNVEINADLINSIDIRTDAETPIVIGLGKTADLPKLTTNINMDETWPDGCEIAVNSDYAWATSNKSVVKISKGQLVGVKEGTTTISATALGTSFSIPVEVSSSASAFKDVKKGSYCYDAVAWAVDQDITTGVDRTHFAPDDDCTRAQVVTFLWREAGRPVPTLKKCPFKDVSKSDYYYNAVLWAVENDITTGVDKTHFKPDDSCTRAQVVTFLWRYDDQPTPSLKKCPFKDVTKSSYCYKAVLWAVGEEITTGIDKTHFAPDDTCTRGQIVTFLYRYDG